MKSKRHSGPAPKRRRRRLFTKLLLFNSGIVVVAVLLVGMLNHSIVQESVLSQSGQELSIKAGQIASLLRTSLVEGLYANSSQGGVQSAYEARLQKSLQEWETLSDARIILCTANQDGTVNVSKLSSRKKGKEQGEGTRSISTVALVNAMDTEWVHTILNGGTSSNIQNVTFLNEQILFAGTPLYLGDEDTRSVALILYRTVNEVRTLSARYTTITFFAGAIALLIAFVLSALMANRITRPIKQITAGARRMSNGEYGIRVPVGENNEIGALGETLNIMSGRLAAIIRSLWQEKSKLELILTSIGEGIVAIDRNRAVAHFNKAAGELLCLRELPAEGREVLQDQENPVFIMLWQALDTGTPAEKVVKNARGESIAIAVSPILEEDGTPAGAVGLLRDVSKAERLEQMRKDYVANVSHELRTPLTGIRGMIEPLMDGCMDTEQEKQESYRIIYQETLRLERLIGEMLDMSRLQDGRAVIELEPMEIAGIVEAACARMKERALKGEVALIREVPDDLPPVMGNEDRIMQLLIILLDNALSFTPAGGEIRVYARREGDMICVGVKDSGSGIAPEDLPLIWERFYKADKSRMRTQGTGLGLSIAKLVTSLLGGEIGVKSRPGEGAQFEFTLRVAPEEPGA